MRRKGKFFHLFENGCFVKTAMETQMMKPPVQHIFPLRIVTITDTLNMPSNETLVANRGE